MKDLLHKRVLVAVKCDGWVSSNSTITELLIMEVSPSGNFVKVRDMDGRRYWKPHAEITPVEILAYVEKAPQENKE